jgi:hypothetical protein
MRDKDIRNILNSIQETYNPAHFDAIRPELEKRKKRRSIVWPWYFLAFAMLLSLSFLLWQEEHHLLIIDNETGKSTQSVAGDSDSPSITMREKDGTQKLTSDPNFISADDRKANVIKTLPVRPLASVNERDIRVDKLNFHLSKETPFHLNRSDMPATIAHGKSVVIASPSYHKFVTQSVEVPRENQFHLSSGLGIAAGGWLNPEEGRLWYTGATFDFQISKGAWSMGLAPSLLQTNNHYRDEWLPVDIADENPAFRESNAGAFAPMTILQKQRVAFAPENQLVLPLFLAWQYNQGSLTYSIGPEAGLTYGWGDTVSQTEGFLGFRGALGCRLGSRSYVLASFAYGRPFSDHWTEFNRASLTYNHYIK